MYHASLKKGKCNNLKNINVSLIIFYQLFLTIYDIILLAKRMVI